MMNDWALAKNPASEPLWLNLDETPLEQELAGRRGNWVRPSRGQDGFVPVQYERIDKAATRHFRTLIAVICNDKELQPEMPQFLLPKHHRLSRKARTRFARLASPLQYIPGEKGWTTASNMVTIITRLADCLDPVAPDRERFLVMGCAAQDMSEEANRIACERGIRIMFVPCLMTPLLQPLDTRVFGLLKQKLRDIQTERREDQVDGRLVNLAWIQCFDLGIREVIVKRDWSKAFADDGLTSGTALRATLVDLVGQEPVTDAAWPTDEELEVLCGRRRPLLPQWLFSNTDRPLAALPPPHYLHLRRIPVKSQSTAWTKSGAWPVRGNFAKLSLVWDFAHRVTSTQPLGCSFGGGAKPPLP